MREIVLEETMCCGYKKCPTLRVYSDGSVELTDDDTASGSIGTIKLAPEQARALARRLQEIE